LLGSVLYYPILASLSKSTSGIGIALAAYALIAVWKFPPWVVVVTSAVLGAAAGALA
jgi:chromate transporter